MLETARNTVNLVMSTDVFICKLSVYAFYLSAKQSNPRKFNCPEKNPVGYFTLCKSNEIDAGLSVWNIEATESIRTMCVCQCTPHPWPARWYWEPFPSIHTYKERETESVMTRECMFVRTYVYTYIGIGAHVC